MAAWWVFVLLEILFRLTVVCMLSDPIDDMEEEEIIFSELDVI